MPFTKLRKLVDTLYSAPLYLRAYLPPEKRELIYGNLFIATVVFLVLTIVSFVIGTLPVGKLPLISFIVSVAPRIYGIFLILFSVTFVFSAFEALHRSYYFTGLKNIIEEHPIEKHIPVSWEVATVVDETGADVTGAFLRSDYGQEVLFRAGVTEEAYETFEKERTATVTPDAFIVERDKGIVLESYTRSVYKHDEAFRDFLATCDINEGQLLRAARWVTEIERKERKAKRWWARDNLGRIPGLGKTWNYGQTYYLEKYGHDLTEDHIWQSACMTRRDEDDEVEALEDLLSKKRQSNALLVTNDVSSARRRVAQLYYKIRKGHTLPILEDRQVFFIDIESIVIAYGDKSSFEGMVRMALNQAASAGNIIVYLEHIASTMESAKVIGVDIIDVIAPFLDSPEIQIIIGESSETFKKVLSHDSRITQAFDVIQMTDVDAHGVFELLKQRARVGEIETGIVFTVPALERIAELADRYFPTGVMPDKAFDLLEELLPSFLSENKNQVLQRDVEELVTRKTHVPTGTPDTKEREKLLNLEDALHERVIAQDSAVQAISKALRRARSGVGNPKKPLGTFMFLGPTGVGKTETAKALAELLFNDEDAMNRLDMSEFQSPASLAELIGSGESEAEGRLETLVRQRQYGVLLLDEFEKAHQGIHDLFLQIFDEGRFTTGSGRQVNLRNLLIIATSNAGADLIWKWEQEGKDVSQKKDELVDHLVAQGLYRPELLNRFDDIIVFHTLSESHIKDIARIHLRTVAERIYDEKNITIKITPKLIDHVAHEGYDPKFGGRPLNRAIQEIVEQDVADKIIAGKLKPGDTYVFEEKRR